MFQANIGFYGYNHISKSFGLWLKFNFFNNPNQQTQKGKEAQMPVSKSNLMDGLIVGGLIVGAIAGLIIGGIGGGITGAVIGGLAGAAVGLVVGLIRGK